MALSNDQTSFIYLLQTIFKKPYFIYCDEMIEKVISEYPFLLVVVLWKRKGQVSFQSQLGIGGLLIRRLFIRHNMEQEVL